MSLRIIVPPHPLIGHWLTVLRNASTPAALYGTGLEELGRWLTYEALRDWLPHRKEKVTTSNAETEGIIIESNIPLITIPISPGGFALWQGARMVLPNAQLCIEGVPDEIESNAGILIFTDQIATGKTLAETVGLLKKRNVQSQRIRVITALASKPGLKALSEQLPELTIYSSCIDSEINQEGTLIPGIGNPLCRLNIRTNSKT